MNSYLYTIGALLSLAVGAIPTAQTASPAGRESAVGEIQYDDVCFLTAQSRIHTRAELELGAGPCNPVDDDEVFTLYTEGLESGGISAQDSRSSSSFVQVGAGSGCAGEGLAFVQGTTHWEVTANTNRIKFEVSTDEAHYIDVDLPPSCPTCPTAGDGGNTLHELTAPPLVVRIPFFLDEAKNFVADDCGIARFQTGFGSFGAGASGFATGCWAVYLDANGDCAPEGTPLYSDSATAYDNEGEIGAQPFYFSLGAGHYVAEFTFENRTDASVGNGTLNLTVANAFVMQLQVSN